MNYWTEQSFKIAKKKGYLDKISEIYIVNSSAEEERINLKQILDIKNLIKKDEIFELMKYLLCLERFPFDDPYIGFIRYDEKALIKNPKTTHRILERLKDLGPDGIVVGINRPKSASRKFGNHFAKWLKNKYRALPEEELLLKKKGIFILDGGDQTLRLFAEKHLFYNRRKGLDFLIKVNKKYVLGEAKFVGHTGGTQDKSVREVLDLVLKYKFKKNVISLAVLDGVPWVAKGSSLYNSLHDLKENQFILSVVLFDSFLKSLL